MRRNRGRRPRLDPAPLLAKVGITPYRVAEDSMTPALNEGDGLLTVRLRRPRFGRIVVLDHPAQPGFVLVKRLIGRPGETVEVRDGCIRINGGALDEPWAQGRSGPDGTWRVGAEAMFVASDARELTLADSRRFGPVPIAGARRVIKVVPGAGLNS